MERIKSLYIDQPSFYPPVKPDDFLITIGAKKSNSVYHISEVKARPRPSPKWIRYYLKVYDSDLPTALQRDKTQQLIPLTWYKR